MPDEATLPENNSCGCFYLANRLFYKAHRLSIIVAVRDVNEAKADRKSTPLYEIENNIHRIVTDILACLVGSSPLRAKSQSETRLEAWRSTGKNRSCPVIWAISPSVYRLGLNPQAFSVRALSEAEDEIGSMLLDCVKKLRLVKFNRKDDFFVSLSSG